MYIHSKKESDLIVYAYHLVTGLKLYLYLACYCSLFRLSLGRQWSTCYTVCQICVSRGHKALKSFQYILLFPFSKSYFPFLLYKLNHRSPQKVIPSPDFLNKQTKSMTLTTSMCICTLYLYVYTYRYIYKHWK